MKQIIKQILMFFNSFISPVGVSLLSNESKFLELIKYAEGTRKTLNPYAVTYSYAKTIIDFSDHPANKGWGGVRLSDSLCRNAGLNPGCVSTAAGAYQFIKPTWNELKRRLNLKDFSPDSQDKAAIQLIKDSNAYQDVLQGNWESAIKKCGKIWASFPNNSYGQNPKKLETLLNFINKI